MKGTSHKTLAINLRYSAGSFRLAVDLDLPTDGISILFGPSGCGKTSLLRCISGLEPSARGLVRFGDQTWLDSQAGVLVPTAKRRLGFVFQDGALFPHLNVEQNLQYALKRVPQPKRRFLRDEIVDLLDLSPLSTRSVTELSGGERQRVALGRALLSSPGLLLLDEPLASLDRSRRREIFPYFERLRSDLAVTMLYVTHDLDEATRLGDHFVLLDQGQAPVAGPLLEVLSGPQGHLLEGHDRRSIVVAQLEKLHQQDHLLELAFAGGTLFVPAGNQSLTGKVRLSIQARDVSITLQSPSDSSILNILPGVVKSVTVAAPGLSLVQIEVGATIILAQITSRSCRALELAQGKAVFAQIKSVALL